MDEKKLKKIFKNLFNLKDNQIENAKIRSTSKWDSFSHINLIIEIETTFSISKIKPTEIVKLNSYKSCLKYLRKKIR
jgi:acyl carrier protein